MLSCGYYGIFVICHCVYISASDIILIVHELDKIFVLPGGELKPLFF